MEEKSNEEQKTGLKHEGVRHQATVRRKHAQQTASHKFAPTTYRSVVILFEAGIGFSASAMFPVRSYRHPAPRNPEYERVSESSWWLAFGVGPALLDCTSGNFGSDETYKMSVLCFFFYVNYIKKGKMTKAYLQDIVTEGVPQRQKAFLKGKRGSSA